MRWLLAKKSSCSALFQVSGGQVHVTCERIINDGKLGIKVSSELNHEGTYVYDDFPEGLVGGRNSAENSREFTLPKTLEAADDVNLTEPPTSVVGYDGRGKDDTMGELIAQGNNSGLGFMNPYQGTSSIAAMNGDLDVKRNDNRSITFKNEGAWATVPTNRKAYKNFSMSMSPIFDFPVGYTSNPLAQNKPDLMGVLAEVGFTGQGRSKTLNASSCLSRGSVYEASNQDNPGLYGQNKTQPLLYLVHLIFAEYWRLAFLWW